MIFLPIKAVSLLAILFLPAVSPANGEDFSDLVYAPPPVGHIEPLEHMQFSNQEQELKFLISQLGEVSVSNHFCIIGYQFADGRQEAVVIWSESNELIRWFGHRNPELAKEGFQYANSLFFSKSLDLDTALVDTPEDIHGSTFLSVRSQAEATVADCNLRGRHYTIEPFIPPEDED